MKRVIMFSLVLMLVLMSSAAFATDFSALNISIQEPQNWQARQDTYPAISRDVPEIELTDRVNTNRWLWIFLDRKQDAAGTPLSLNEVGSRYVQWHTENDRRADRIDDRKTKGYFELEYYITALNTRRQVFIDNEYDTRIIAGQYLCYLYPDTVTEDEVLEILSTMTINGQRGSGTGGETGGGTGGGTGDKTDTTTSPDNKPVGSSGGGGGGCSAGTASLSLFAVLAAFIIRKSK